MSMVAEIARNHLTQQEIDEDDPAIFGQQVEIDSIKRKREQVVLSELELKLAEQEGARKRRLCESCQYCLEAMESVGGANDRDKGLMTDMLRRIAFGSTSSTDQLIRAAGRTLETGIDCKVIRN